MLEARTLPRNFAFTGPIAAVSATLYSLSDTRSMLSQPGMQALRISGSLSASHTRCCGRGMCCSPLISMLPILLIYLFRAPHWAGLRDYAPAFVAFKSEVGT